ncbi:MAG: DUF2784 family protein [Micromonosporaceae bacterium]
MPAVGAGVVEVVSVRLKIASPLRSQWGSTWRFRDTTAGRSLSGARRRIALLPVGVSRAAGPRRTHAGPRRSSELGDGPTVTGAPEPLSDRARPWWTNERAGQPGLPPSGFVDRYIEGVIYPERFSVAVQWLVAAAVITSWLGVFMRWRRRSGRAGGWAPWSRRDSGSAQLAHDRSSSR